MLMRITQKFAKACKQIQDSGFFASEGEWKDIDSVDDDLCRFILKHSGAYTAVDLGRSNFPLSVPIMMPTSRWDTP
ncbi:hypothetical protein P7H09_00145 [Paenibacillus larvae]|uniref:Uncharacterized protein n=1 Tax=Paenibacillus larvae TaxID=1464 RepID=A0AAP5JQJ4_9BACL|nr:hypothetical protein [Paenibacillus larvae]